MIRNTFIHILYIYYTYVNDKECQMDFLSWGCLQTVKKLILAQLRFFLSFLFSFFTIFAILLIFKMCLLVGNFFAKLYIFCVTHLNLHFKLLEYFDGKLSVENSSPAWKKENIAQNTQNLSFNSMKKLHKNTFQVSHLYIPGLT